MILLNKSSSLIKYLKVSAIAEVDMWRSRFGRKSRRDLKKSSTRRHTTWYRYQSWVKQRVLSTFILSILFRSVAFRVPGLACGKRRNVTVGYTPLRANPSTAWRLTPRYPAASAKQILVLPKKHLISTNKVSWHMQRNRSIG